MHLYIKKTCKNYNKPIYGLKNPKKPLKNWKWTRIQKLTRGQICFFTNFKGIKTPNTNFPHEMKPFDTNIVYFGGLNR